MTFQMVLDEARKRSEEQERKYIETKKTSYTRIYGDIKQSDKSFKKWSVHKEMILMMRRQGETINQIASQLCSIGFMCNADDVFNFLKRNEHEL